MSAETVVGTVTPYPANRYGFRVSHLWGEFDVTFPRKELAEEAREDVRRMAARGGDLRLPAHG